MQPPTSLLGHPLTDQFCNIMIVVTVQIDLPEKEVTNKGYNIGISHLLTLV